MRNFVAKNDFNRASTHKSEKDYARISKHDLQALVMDAWDDLDDVELEFGPEERLPLKDPKQWESSKMKEVC